MKTEEKNNNKGQQLKQDWTGNYHSVVGCLGAHNLTKEDREEFDYYATQPIAAEWLCKLERLNQNIWECACGEGHLSKVLECKGFNVRSTDLIDRGYGLGGWIFLNKLKFGMGILLLIHHTDMHRSL